MRDRELPRWTKGEPENAAAAAADALCWLNVLSTNAALLRMGQADIRGLNGCIKNLRALIAPEWIEAKGGQGSREEVER